MALRAHAALLRLLALARDLGFCGPAAPEDQIERSLAFTRILTAPSFALDLGSGAGIPGLPLALAWPQSRWYLLDSNQKRAAWLREALVELGLDDRCQVAQGRAEVLARTALRGKFDLVTARGFGPPAATAECGAPFLNERGQLVVPGPPTCPPPSADEAPLAAHESRLALCEVPVEEVDGGRWPSAGLAQLGLQLAETQAVMTKAGPVTLSRLVVVGPCPGRYPRRVGVPSKRPLF